MKTRGMWCLFCACLVALCFPPSADGDLADIQARGVIRHLGVPYANFVTGDGDGLDVEIVKLYAKHIGVRYEYVRSSWATVIGDLSGKQVIPRGEDVEIAEDTIVKGDIIGNGLTILPWRTKAIDFSQPYFPTAVWVIARCGCPVASIPPTGDISRDIAAMKKVICGMQILGIPNTCLDPTLYGIPAADIAYKPGLQLNDLPPALVKREFDIALQDVPNAIEALQKYPGKISVVGAVSEPQAMAFGMSKDNPELLRSFNAFLDDLRKSGRLRQLILHYFPLIGHYFPTAGK